MTLNQVVEEYLNSNGIKKEYFASYIGCGLSKCTMWFKGERKLNTEQLQKTHEFLSGKHIKTVEDAKVGCSCCCIKHGNSYVYRFRLRLAGENLVSLF